MESAAWRDDGPRDGSPYNTGRTDRAGNAVWELTMFALETLPGFHREGNSLRACCPAHQGDNPSALRINLQTGVGTCGRCSATFIVTDHVAQQARQEDWERRRAPVVTIGGKPRRLSPPPRPATPVPSAPVAVPTRPAVMPTPEALDDLRAALGRYAESFRESPAERYLQTRHIPTTIAMDLGWGWGGVGPVIGLPRIDPESGQVTSRDAFRGRVTIPLCGPDGTIIGASGRAVDDTTRPKYLVTSARRGIKALMNGGAIGQAIAADAPLLVVEGLIDAAAIIAGGLPLAVAIGSTNYAHPRHFRGLRHAVILPDNDGAAGVEGARRVREALELEGVHVTTLDPGITGEHKDIAAYWAAHDELPAALIAASTMIAPVSRWAGYGTGARQLAPSAPVMPPADLDDQPIGKGDETAPPNPGAPGDELTRRIRHAGVHRRPISAAIQADVDLTVADLQADQDYSADAFALDVVRNWQHLSDDDRLAAWLTWRTIVTVGSPADGSDSSVIPTK